MQSIETINIADRIKYYIEPLTTSKALKPGGRDIGSFYVKLNILTKSKSVNSTPLSTTT